ncbi:unnamed protein product [Trichogramma brassicae]|uniref:Rho-GAP domain-containing protein n=1 Tax=Trichogramma brassicae TaxID=86971 RepID=A0A6H5I5R2_9HYME|nr:unnamed protein product [Trichogramma brassicae]
MGCIGPLTRAKLRGSGGPTSYDEKLRGASSQEREQWPLFSSYSCWQQLINETKNLSRDHAALSEVYSTHLVARLNQVMEDVQRIYKRCREIGYETHEEILRVLHELHTTMKTYQAYQAESRQAETKLRVAEAQRSKLEVTSAPPEKLARSKKYKLIEKEVNKRKIKYTEARLKALKARNEYMLCLEASNTTIHKYFVEDLSDLIDCMDFGFHNCVARALMMHCSAEEGRQRSLQAGAEQLAAQVNALDSRADKQRFLEAHHAAFMIPKKFEFQAGRSEVAGSVTAQAAAKLATLDNNGANNSAAAAAVANLIGAEPELQKLLRSEMEQRLGQLQTRVTTLRTESEEVWKTLETAEASLLEMLTAKDYDCSKYFGENGLPSSRPPETAQIKLRADRHETEEFYLSKFREYLLGTSRIARLDAKQDYIRRILMQASDSGQASPSLSAGAAASAASAAAANAQKQARRKRIGRLQLNARQPKLFGGSLEEYLESTNQEIPLIVRSCVRVINLYGLHHQGIFRVSGSQVEINNFREWFERGEDPLADVTDASDINSVAGVLKLYLRELREPLFPIIYFEQLMELAQLDSKHEFVSLMWEIHRLIKCKRTLIQKYIHLKTEITTGPRAARPPSLERDSMSNGLSITTPGAGESRDELDESSSSSHQEQQIAVPQQFADEVSSSSSSSASSSLTSTPLQQRAAARKYPWKSQSMGEQQQRQQLRQDDLSADEQNSFSANRELWQRRAASQGQLLPPVPGPKPQTPRATPDLREFRQKHAPDLVLDLPPSAQEAKPVPGAAEEIADESNNEGEAEPINQAALQPTVNCSIPPSSGPESPDMSTAAERFAKQNQCTLKKRPQAQGEGAQVVQQQIVAVPASISDQNEAAPPQPIVRSASSSQITPMIAAKFAELHLTGGSQLPAGLPLPPGCKPQMKIKPLVLRKPVLPPLVQPSPELGGRKVDSNKQPEQPAN